MFHKRELSQKVTMMMMPSFFSFLQFIFLHELHRAIPIPLRLVSAHAASTTRPQRPPMPIPRRKVSFEDTRGVLEQPPLSSSLTHTNPSPPPRPPPPRLFPETSTNDTLLNEKPLQDDIPELNIPKRNPRMYELVAQDSTSSSFWWDSVDAKDNPIFGLDHGSFLADFETELSMSVYEGRRRAEEWSGVTFFPLFSLL